MINSNDTNSSNSSAGGSYELDPLPSDYIEMVLLAGYTVVGSVVNARVAYAYANKYLRRANSSPCRNMNDLKATYLRLKLHLTFANLVICGFIAPWKMGWLLTYSWLGGDLLCRLTHVLCMFGVHFASILTAVIALNRYLVVRRSTACTRNQASYRASDGRLIRLLIILSYVIAFACSAYQFVVWRVIKPFPDLDWYQCVSYWVDVHIQSPGANAGNATSSSPHTDWLIVFSFETYQLTHLATAFWLPFAVIFVSYACIWYTLHQYSSHVQKTSMIGAKQSLAPSATISNANATPKPSAVGQPDLLSANEASLHFINRSPTSPTMDKWSLAQQPASRNTSIRSVRFSIGHGGGHALCNGGGGDIGSALDRRSSRSASNVHEPTVALTSFASSSVGNGRVGGRTVSSATTTSEASAFSLAIAASRASVNVQAAPRLNRNAFVSSTAIVVCYLISFAPYSLLALLLVVLHEQMNAYEGYVWFFNSLIFFNSVVSPFLYSYKRPRHRARQRQSATVLN